MYETEGRIFPIAGILHSSPTLPAALNVREQFPDAHSTSLRFDDEVSCLHDGTFPGNTNTYWSVTE